VTILAAYLTALAAIAIPGLFVAFLYWLDDFNRFDGTDIEPPAPCPGNRNRGGGAERRGAGSHAVSLTSKSE